MHMNKVRCAVLDDYQQAAHRMAEWSQLGPDVEVTFFRDPLGSIDAAVDALAAFDVVVLMRERTAFPRELIERLPTLKLIVTTGHRNGALDIAAARKQGICVCGTGTLEPPTVELAWGLILSFARCLPEEVANLRAGGRWQQSLGIDLAGKQLGVLGLGRLGTRVARVAQAFDMNVVAWSANLDDARCEAAGVQRAATLDALLAGSDIVTIHMVLSARTRGLIGTRELGLMKPGAFLVNTSRAPIVDEAALLAALERRQIAGAALDVYPVEPLPAGHVMRRLDNLVATPHLGYVTENSYRLMYGMVVEDIAAWRGGAPIREILEDHPAMTMARSIETTAQ